MRGQGRASQPLLLQMLKTLCFEEQTQQACIPNPKSSIPEMQGYRSNTECMTRHKCTEVLLILFQVLHIKWQIGLQKANFIYFSVNNKDHLNKLKVCDWELRVYIFTTVSYLIFKWELVHGFFFPKEDFFLMWKSLGNIRIVEWFGSSHAFKK